MMKKNNQAIMASAGTGKTYNLAMRYLRLMQEGASPASIVALTFSNKAAGEILDKIIDALLELIEEDGKIRNAVNDGHILPGYSPEDFKGILHSLLSCRERLQISTIDSFFMQILQAFPMECGIAGNISMIDEEDDRIRLQALLKLFASAAPEKRRELLEYLKEISFGNEGKSVKNLMVDFLRYTYPIYLDNPEPELWKNSKKIWSAYDPGMKLDAESLKNITATLSNETFLTSQGISSDGLRTHFKNFVEKAENYEFVKKLDEKSLKYLFRPFDENPDLLRNNLPIHLTFGRATKNKTNVYTFGSELARIFRKLICHLLTVEFNYITAKTRALHDIFTAFDKTYAANARNAGLLTFNDVTCLIRGNTATAIPYTDLVTLEERIDAKTDHYMLDEFQDTSNQQWKILSNLADEAINNNMDERNRSFFFVGDIKQSIYQWRQGNPKLFGMICAHYKFSDDGADGNLLSTLELSYRSSVPVIETVNKVFQTTLFPPADEKGMLRRAIEAMQFKTHSSAPPAAAQPGCVMMAEMPEKDVRKKAYAIAELIRKLDPFNPQRKKSLTVGILVRTNDSGTELADILIGEGLNVTVDGKLDPTQSLAFSAYKQMLRLAAHPADKMAQGFLDMLRFDGQKVSLPDAEEIRKIITRQGFYAFTHKFMTSFHDMPPFDLSRMKVVETAALRADQSENRTIDEFLAELDLLKESASSIRNTVQIMTIHKSKGLDFDIVIMPETSRSNGNIVKRRHSNDIAIRKDENGLEAQWISFLPNSAFIPLLPEVRKYSEEADFAACYENCCNLYVAMTRARNALYIFNDPAPENAAAVQYADFLRAALEEKCPCEKIEQGQRFTDDFISPVCVSYVCGDPEWFRKDTPSKDKELTPSGLAEKQEKDFRLKLREESRIETVIPVKRPCRIKPSAAHEKEQTYIFREQKAADLGTRLHDILAEFGFYTNDSDVSAFLQNRCTTAEELQLLSSFFRSPEIQNALLMPAGRYELWREKRFLSTLDNGIVNGCFDRVLIRLADDGTIVDAEILDYKSDRDVTPETLQERHAPQLDLYRKVLANLIHLDSAKIRCTLLSVRYGFAVSF